MAQPHPLKPFELVQSALEGAFEASFVAEQAIQCGRLENDTTRIGRDNHHRIGKWLFTSREVFPVTRGVASTSQA